ncbi:unnamed protein product [Camellia sinensis]
MTYGSSILNCIYTCMYEGERESIAGNGGKRAANHVKILRRFVSGHLISAVNMTTSRRLADRKVSRFEKNITKRGAVPETTTKKGNDYPVGPILLGFFIFVVIGSYDQDGNEWKHGLSKCCYIVANGYFL